MRRVRSQFLQSVARLGLAVRDREVAGGVVAPRSCGTGARFLAVTLLAFAASASPAMAAKGVLSTFGSAGAGPGQFSNAANGLRGVAVDQGSGDVYVVDGGNHRVQRFTASGAFVSQLGSGSSGTMGGLFNSPWGVAVNPLDGSVYVSDGANLRVQKFSSAGSFIRAFGWDTIIAAGPPPNSNGTSFEVCDTTALVPNLATDCKAGSNGVGDGQLGTTFNGHPAVDPSSGNLYVADPGGASARRVQRFSGANGAFEGRWGGEGAGLGQFGSGGPTHAAVDSAGAVYVVDPAGAAPRVQKCVPSGTPPAVTASCSLFASYTVGAAVNTTPVAVAVDPSNDHVLVARRNASTAGDALFGTGEVVVDEFASSGGPVLATYGAGAGIGYSAGQTDLNQATGLAVRGSTGRFYLSVPDTSAPRVYVFGEVAAPSVTFAATEAGSDSATFHATVTPSTSGLKTFYRFEYSTNGIDWVKAPASDVDLGNGSGSGDPASCPVGNPPTCEVSQQVTGLAPDRDYHLRVVARTEFNSASVTVAGADFTTSVSPPAAETGTAMWSSPADTDPTLLLTGRVTPRNGQTTYQFQYVTQAEFDDAGYANARTAPTTAADAGSRNDAVAVHESVSGLDPTTLYHYRLVATNSTATTNGADRTIAPPGSDDRYYERVSDGDSWGIGIYPSVDAIADSGGRAQFRAQAFGDPDSVAGPSLIYTAHREASGWEVSAPFPSADEANGAPGGVQNATSPDLGTTLWPEASRFQQMRGEVRWELIHIDGTKTPASELLAPLSSSSLGGGSLANGYDLFGASGDLSTFAFGNLSDENRTFFSDEYLVATPHTTNLYAVSGAGTANPVFSLVNRQTDPSPVVPGAVIGGACGARLGANVIAADTFRMGHAISDDGSIVYFSASASAPATGLCSTAASAQTRLYKRIGGTVTVPVSASQCVRVSPVCSGSGHDRYQGASADGAVVFFTSPRQLTDSDLDTTDDLYVYDADPPVGRPNLVQASAGEAVAGHPTVGSGASIATFVDNSADGSRAYFTATGVLTGANSRGASPIAGQRNMYVYQRDSANPDGRIAFVATISPSEAGGNNMPFFGLPTEGAAADGRLLLFASTSPLLGDDGDAASDVYRYDDSSGGLLCLSCVGDTNVAATISAQDHARSRANWRQYARPATSDGSKVVFTTSEQLLAADQNGARDVYLWDDGDLTLVSGGTGTFGVASPNGTANLTGISADGQNVFFPTQAALAASDVNRLADLYVARVGGGFPARETPPDACSALADACQGAGSETLATQPKTSTGGGDADLGQRVTLALRQPGLAARRRVARTGVLRVALRSSGSGTVRLVARARVDGKVRIVGRASKVLTAPGSATIGLRLSRPARLRLDQGRALRLVVQARSADARLRAITVRLPGASS